MGFFRTAVKEEVKERRSIHRIKVDVPATLETMTGARDVQLSDISVTGARVNLANPPRIGVSGMLTWEGQEVFCTTVWTREDCCGVEFERPISLSSINRISQGAIPNSGPAANLERIPLGRKRTRLC